MGTDACIFCRIVAGQMPAKVVAENEDALAFLDVHPLVDGHTLVVPKRHAAHLADMDDAGTAAVFRLVRDVSRAQRSALAAQAVTVGVNDGKAAGQVVPHVHVHVLPRREGDGGKNVHAIVRSTPARSLDEVATALSAALSSHSG